jgi:hypothetical protein
MQHLASAHLQGYLPATHRCNLQPQLAVARGRLSPTGTHSAAAFENESTVLLSPSPAPHHRLACEIIECKRGSQSSTGEAPCATSGELRSVP